MVDLQYDKIFPSPTLNQLVKFATQILRLCNQWL